MPLNTDGVAGFSPSRWQMIKAVVWSRQLGTQAAQMQLMPSQTGPPLSHHSSGKFPSSDWASSACRASAIATHARVRDHLGQRSMLHLEDLHKILPAVCDNTRKPVCTPCLWEQARLGGWVGRESSCSVAVPLDSGRPGVRSCPPWR